MAEVYKPEVETDSTGRIIHLKTTEHVAADSESAVQALPVQRETARAEGATTEVLSADHPDAVQALPAEDHPLLDRLDEEEAQALRDARQAALDAEPEVAAEPEPADNHVEPEVEADADEAADEA